MSKNIELLKAIIKCASINFDYIVLGDRELAEGVSKLKSELNRNNIIGVLDSRKSLLNSGFNGKYISFYQELKDLVTNPSAFSNKRLGYLVKYSRLYLPQIDPNYVAQNNDNLEEKIELIQINVANSQELHTFFENEVLLTEIIKDIGSPMFLEKTGHVKTLNRR